MKTTTHSGSMLCSHSIIQKKELKWYNLLEKFIPFLRAKSDLLYFVPTRQYSPVATSHSMCVYMEIDFITYLLKGDTWVASKNTFRSSYRSQFFFCKKLICSNWKRQDSSIAHKHVCSLSCSRDMQWEILFATF